MTGKSLASIFRLLGGVIGAGWGAALSGVLLFISLRIFTTELDSETFGIAMLVLGMLALVDGISTMAFGQVLALLLKDREAGPERQALALGLARMLVPILASLAVIAVLVCWVTLGEASAALLALIAIPFCLTEGLRSAAQMLALLDRRYAIISGWTAAEAAATLAFSLLAIRFTAGAPIALLLGGMSARILLGLVGSCLVMGNPLAWRADRAGARAVRPQAIAFGWSVAAMAPLGWLGSFSDRYVVGATVGLGPAGILAALSGAAMKPYSVVSTGLTNLFRPDLLDEAAGREPVHQKPLSRWLYLALGIGLAGIAAFWLLGDAIANWLIRFPTPGTDAGTLLVVIAASQLLVLMTHPFDNALLAAGRGRSLLLVQLLVLLGGIPLIAFGAIQFGTIGAALGRVANEGAKLLAAAALVGIGRRGRSDAI